MNTFIHIQSYKYMYIYKKYKVAILIHDSSIMTNQSLFDTLGVYKTYTQVVTMKHIFIHRQVISTIYPHSVYMMFNICKQYVDTL